MVLSKPARPGKVKTRLVGALTPEQAAALHAVFLADLLERLRRGDFDLSIAWQVGAGEEPPDVGLPAWIQEGTDLGARLHHSLERAGQGHALVAAVGSDHPDLPLERVEEAFGRLERGAEVVLGPAQDGGYYLIGFRREALREDVFAGIPWSTAGVLAATLERCAAVGLRATLLEPAADVDTPADLDRLVAALAAGPSDCPRTLALLRAWGRIPAEARA